MALFSGRCGRAARRRTVAAYHLYYCMTPLLSRLRDHVARRRLFAAGGTAVVAVSGGPDSVALLDLVHSLAPELGLALVVAHADHGIQADSSSVGQAVPPPAPPRGACRCTTIPRTAIPGTCGAGSARCCCRSCPRGWARARAPIWHVPAAPRRSSGARGTACSVTCPISISRCTRTASTLLGGGWRAMITHWPWPCCARRRGVRGWSWARDGRVSWCGSHGVRRDGARRSGAGGRRGGRLGGGRGGAAGGGGVAAPARGGVRRFRRGW